MQSSGENAGGKKQDQYVHADDCPGPEFLCGVDQSTEILCALEATLLGRASQKSEALPQADTSGAWSGISRNLKKVRGLYQ